MPDSVTKTTSRSWFSRVGGAFVGVIVGIILVFGSIAALSWNEGRAIKTIQGLKEGARLVVEAPISPIDAANNQKLVHVSGPVTVTASLTDSAYGVSATGVRLVRTVEMYQWQESSTSETRTKLGGGEETVTTFTYAKAWSGSATDSAAFNSPAGHENPPFTIEGVTVTAQDATLGAFKLTDTVIDNIGGAAPLPMNPDQTTAIAAAAGGDRPVRIAENYIYLGQPGRPAVVSGAPANPTTDTPQIGDLRIAYAVTPAAVISVVAMQNEDGFMAFRAANGEEVMLVNDGTVTAAEMFAGAQSANQFLTWALRVVGLVAMIIGFSLLFAPLGVLGDVIPLFGTIIRMGTGLVGFVLAMVIGSITIALSWIVFRPLVGIAILAVGGLIAFLAFRFGGKKAKAGEVAVEQTAKTE